jgi:hypothetical protein
MEAASFVAKVSMLLDKYERSKEWFINERMMKRDCVLRLVRAQLTNYRHRLRTAMAVRYLEDNIEPGLGSVTRVAPSAAKGTKSREVFSLTQPVGTNSTPPPFSEQVAVSVKTILTVDLDDVLPDTDDHTTIGLEVDLTGLEIDDETLHYVLDAVGGSVSSEIETKLTGSDASQKCKAGRTARAACSSSGSGSELPLPDVLALADSALMNVTAPSKHVATTCFLPNLFYLNLKSNKLTDLSCKVRQLYRLTPEHFLTLLYARYSC